MKILEYNCSYKLAGRGTDININEEILRKGGLHVCLTLLPKNIKFQEHAFGRGWRKREPGTWQLVINLFQTIKEISYLEYSEESKRTITDSFNNYIDLFSKLGNNIFYY